MIRCLIHDNFSSYTKTCKKKWWDECGVLSCRIRDSYSVFYEFWEGHKFIGAMYGDNFFEDSKEIYIDHIFVNGKYRNKGYGRYMINYLTQDYKYIYVESTQEAYEFYRKLGFKKKRSQNNRIYSDTIDMQLIFKKDKKEHVDIKKW